MTSNATPVIRAVSLVLAHVPSFVRLGSKPLRSLREVEKPIDYLRPYLRDWDAAQTSSRRRPRDRPDRSPGLAWP